MLAATSPISTWEIGEHLPQPTGQKGTSEIMGVIDPFGRTDTLDQGILKKLVTRFEARAKHPTFSKMLDEYLEAMDLDDAGFVLDLGCGSGLAARAIAHRDGFSGKVAGVDLSAYLVTIADHLAREEGVAEHTDFHTGDVYDLAFADGTFDAVVAYTLLSHVDEPSIVLKEASRVLKRGGMLGMFDGDYASLTFDHADPVKGKAYDEALISAVVTNPRVMRQMPRLLRQVGSIRKDFARITSADPPIGPF